MARTGKKRIMPPNALMRGALCPMMALGACPKAPGAHLREDDVLLIALKSLGPLDASVI